MDGVMHPSVEQAIGRDRIRKAFKRYENNPVDEHDRGIVRAVNADGSYEVLLDGDVQTARCAPYAKAMVGDRVIVVTTKDGENVLLGRLGGEIGGGGEIVTTVNDASNYVAGKVFAHAGTNDPAGALLCDGRAVSRREYWELFDAIGTTYGAGDGSSTFNLPSIESRTIIGESDSYALGATGGEEKHLLTVEETPSHSHTAEYGLGYGSGGSVGDRVLYGAAMYTGRDNWRTPSYTGGDQPHNNMQPYIVMRYFITTGKGDPASGINPADYVVEWNANDNGWYWEKWASGKAECGTFLENYVLDSTYDDLYYTHTTVNLPFEFKTVKNVQATGQDENNLIDASVSNITTTSVRVYISAPVANITDGCVSLKVTGTWKDSPASSGVAVGHFENATVDGTLHLTNATDASGTADKDVALIIGDRDGNHMILDTNEIIAKSSGSSETMLWIGEQLGNVGIGGVKYGVNNVLWSSSGLYMNASQTATLSEAVSKQAHGIVLVFSSYSSGAGDNANFHSFFVPKAHVAAHPGKGSEFVMASSNAPGSFRFKYLYISDTAITGNADNSWDGTSGSGVKVTNSGAVLRYVIGV